MRVVVTVKGRFHGFQLAKALQDGGHLHRLMTTLPKIKAAQYGLRRDLVTSLLRFEIFDRAGRTFSKLLGKGWQPGRWFHDRIGAAFAKRIPQDTEIFVGWSSFSLEGIRVAKATGAITILERGSNHIVSQRDILSKEYSTLGVFPRLPLPGIVEKELAEYEEADFIAIPSTRAKESFLANGVPMRKLIVTPYGVDIQRFKPLDVEPGPFRVIHCGGLTVQKGVQNLLRAFNELSLPKAELWLVGSVTPEILPFLRRFLTSSIRVWGSVPEFQLPKIYSQCSVLCLASVQEGFGMVLTQAMACGLPLICTEATAGPDLITDGVEGFVIPVGSVESIKEKILLLYKNQELCREMGNRAYLRATAEYSWHAYGLKMVANYERMLRLKGQSFSERVQ